MDNSLDSRKPRVGAIIQARMGSSRLPGKALLSLPLGGKECVLGHVIRRAQLSNIEVGVATSSLSTDDPIERLANQLNVPVYRGSENDVLARFTEAATQFNFHTVVRLTADNPAIDPFYLQKSLQYHQQTQADYTLTVGLPLGTNFEIIDQHALSLANTLAQLADEREHVTPYLRRHPDDFRLSQLDFSIANPEWSRFRLTMDYPSDYSLLHILFSCLPTDFGLAELSRLVEQYPWLIQVNEGNQQVKVS